MGGVDLANEMHRLYTCIQKSSQRWYLWLFWFLVELAIDNDYILECCIQDSTHGQCRHNTLFHKEPATNLLSKHSSQKIFGCQVQNSPARLSQWHFQTTQELIVNVQCVAKSIHGHIVGMGVKIVEMSIYVYCPALGFSTQGFKYLYIKDACLLVYQSSYTDATLSLSNVLVNSVCVCITI